MRREILSWNDVDKLIDHLIPQFDAEYDGMIMITRGGVIPGGMLAQALNLKRLLTASVDFPEIGAGFVPHKKAGREIDPGMYAWPVFLQFPDDRLLSEKRILIVDDVWASGRTILAVRSRVVSAGATPYTCVLHYNPHTNRFKNVRPEYFAAITDAYIVYPWESNRGLDRVMQAGFNPEK